MHVTKVVDLFTKIPEQLSLHFSKSFIRIYKFAVFENKRKRKWDFASRPLERIGGSQISPWPEPGTEEAAAAFPGEGVHWRRGEVGERIEEIESYSEVVFSRSGAAGRGVG